MWHKFIRFWKVFFLTVWEVIKEMRTVRGILALLISYIIYHGWAVFFVAFGTIVGNAWMIGIGTAVILFWFGPGTPVIPLIIVTALFIQRYLLFDKKHMVNIIDKWKELNDKEISKHEDHWKQVKHDFKVMNVIDHVIFSHHDDDDVKDDIETFLDLDSTFYGFQDFELKDKELQLVCIKKTPGNPDIKYVPMYTFNVVVDSLVVGKVDIRIGHVEGLYYGGHIAYQIKETYRGKGYATRATKLLAKVGLAHHMDKLYISNRHDNRNSIRVCQKVGATYIRTVLLPEDNPMRELGNVYENIWVWDITK